MALKYYIIGICFFLILNQGCSAQDSDVASLDPDSVLPVIIPNSTLSPPKTTVTPSTTSLPPSPSPSPSTTSSTTSTTTTTPTTPTTSTTTIPPAPSTNGTTAAPSTTEKPTTTTAPSTTVAPPAPTPIPDPEDGTWVLGNSAENLTCAVIHMALRMKIPYTVENKTEWGMLNLGKNANITGNCDNTTLEKNITRVKLSWENNTNFLEFTFLRDDEKKSFNISQLILSQNISGDAFPNNTMNTVLVFMGNASGLLSVESVPVGRSYKCSHKVNVNLTNTPLAPTTMPDAMLVFSKLQIQAFMNSTTTGFGSVLECPGLDASDIVPIAVGCALAGLVIGVLIAYLVGRRRSHVRGYLSM